MHSLVSSEALAKTLWGAQEGWEEEREAVGVGETGLHQVRRTTRGITCPLPNRASGQRPNFSAGWTPGLDPIRGGQKGVSDLAHPDVKAVNPEFKPPPSLRGCLPLGHSDLPQPRLPQSRAIAAAQMRPEAAEAPRKPETPLQHGSGQCCTDSSSLEGSTAERHSGLRPRLAGAAASGPARFGEHSAYGDRAREPRLRATSRLFDRASGRHPAKNASVCNANELHRELSVGTWTEGPSPRAQRRAGLSGTGAQSAQRPAWRGEATPAFPQVEGDGSRKREEVLEGGCLDPALGHPTGFPGVLWLSPALRDFQWRARSSPCLPLGAASCALAGDNHLRAPSLRPRPRVGSAGGGRRGAGSPLQRRWRLG